MPDCMPEPRDPIVNLDAIERTYSDPLVVESAAGRHSDVVLALVAELKARRAAEEVELGRRSSSLLVRHAVRELEMLGQTREDPEFAASLVDAVAAFSSYGHSGGSAEAGKEMLAALLSFENLAPLTTARDEWVDRSIESGVPLWQSVRNSKVFSDTPPWEPNPQLKILTVRGYEVFTGLLVDAP